MSSSPTPEDWYALTQRVARSVQTTIGWIFWDPGAVRRYESLGLPGPIGYIASRCAPLAPSGPDAVIAAFGSISPAAISFTFELVSKTTDFETVWRARDEAVVEGLHEYAPSMVPLLESVGSRLWEIVDAIPKVGRVFFSSHLRMKRPTHPMLSGWHAVNCLREWRGDTHWALVASSGLTGIEASVLHNAWLAYEENWLPASRGSGPEEIENGWGGLEAKGLADGRVVNEKGIALRQWLEDETDRQTSLPWELLGFDFTNELIENLEPPCELLLKRVDETAGPNYQPASRIRPRR